MKKLSLAVLIAVTFLMTCPATMVQAQAAPSAKLYELRIYTASPGRLGDLETVMSAEGVGALGRHGIQNIFDGTVLEGAPIDGPDASNMLVCILAHDNRAAADKSWAAFDSDPAWKSAWAAAEKSGPLLAKQPMSLFMNATDFSPALEAPTAAGAPTRIFELRKYNTGPDRLQNTVDEFQQGLAAILVKVGMNPVIYWTADDRSSFVYLIAHKDRETARASWTAFRPEFGPFIAAFNAKQAAAAPPAPAGASPTPPLRRTPDDNRFLVPTSFSPRR